MGFPISMVIVRRVKPLPYWIVPVLALLIGIAVSMIILYVMSGGTITPIDVLYAIKDGFIKPQLLAMTFSLLAIVGVGLVVSFKGAVFNIGGEGQIYMGAMLTVWAAMFAPFSASLLSNSATVGVLKVLMVILAALAGAFWAFLASLPRAFLQLDEVPVTLMMNYIAYYIVDILVRGPWHETQYGYLRTETMPEALWLHTLRGTTISIEVLIILIIVFVGAFFFLRYTTPGLYIRILGNNPNLLRSSGINVQLVTILALTVSGLIIGLVGAGYVAGITHNLSYPVEEKSAQYGYTGILVAWLSMLELIAVPIAAYIIAALYNAGISMQIAGAGGAATVFIFIGSILITYTALITISEYKIKIIIKR